MDTISFDDFLKVDIRIGTVIEVLPFPEARKPAYRMKVDFGPEIGVRKTSAQVTVRYTMAELLGRKVAAVVNFPPKQIGPFISECLVLGFPDPKGAVVLIDVDRAIHNGGRLH